MTSQQPTVREQITATIDRLRDRGAIYALDDHERDRIADELLPVLAAAPLAVSDPERAMLQFALELGQDQVFSRSSEFSDEDTAALESLHARAAATGGAR